MGKFWLGREEASPKFYVYWYDDVVRKTRRKSTKLTDLNQAKLFLAKLALSTPPKEPSADGDVALASLRHFYFKYHARHIRSQAAARRAFDLLDSYLAAVQPVGIPSLKTFSLARQQGFMGWCRDSHALSAKSIATYLTYIKSACRIAAQPRLLRDVGGGEREGCLLERAPYIEASEVRVAAVTGLPRSRPRQWIPSDAELAAIISEIHDEHVFRYMIIALNTWARPEAICQISVDRQVDFSRDLIHLNPHDRLQTNKIRPTIRLTDNLKGWLLFWRLDRPIAYNGFPVAEVSNRTLRKAAVRAQISEPSLFTRYTLRHYMATRVRRVPEVRVSREQRARWMGHVDPHHRTTEAWYESLDPEYLRSPAEATDAILVQLNCLSTRSLFAPGASPGSRLILVNNQAKTDERNRL